MTEITTSTSYRSAETVYYLSKDFATKHPNTAIKKTNGK